MPFKRIQDEDIFYSWTPVGKGPSVVLIHGLGSSHAFYSPIIPKLVESGLSCLAIDTPGSGTSRYSGRDRDVKELSRIVKKMAAGMMIDLSNSVIVGHSMGGLIASDIALTERVLGTVLIGPVLPSDAIASAFAQRIQTVTSKGIEPIADTVPTAATGSKATTLHRAFIRALIMSQSAEGYMSLCRTIANATIPVYGGITSPMLLIAGADDKTVLVESCKDTFERWGGENKKMEILDGVGHWHCIESADEVCRLINSFVHDLNPFKSNP